LDEAEKNLEALQKTREVTEARQVYYEGREKINAKEQLNLDSLEESRRHQTIAGDYEVEASNNHMIPNVSTGAPPSTSFGGSNLGAASNANAANFRNLSNASNYNANKASIMAGYDRRSDDWQFQAEQAAKELDQIDKQIAAAEVRIALLEKEIDNHELQLSNSKEVYDYMSSKYTNAELYSWMVSQISTLYFQSYQMAYDLAKQAQKAYQYELASEPSFVEPIYWDSLKKGLLAGEKLQFDLGRMEVAYLANNKREYE